MSQPPNTSERLSRLIGNLVVNLEEKAAQLDAIAAENAQLRATVKQLQEQLELVERPPHVGGC